MRSLRWMLLALLPVVLIAARPAPRFLHTRYALVGFRVPLPDSIATRDSAAVDRWLVPRVHMAAHVFAMMGAPPDSAGFAFAPEDPTPAPAPLVRRSAGE